MCQNNQYAIMTYFHISSFILDYAFILLHSFEMIKCKRLVEHNCNDTQVDEVVEDNKTRDYVW